jgi:hypothetical protein
MSPGTAPDLTGAAAASGWDAAWCAALETMELEADLVERLLRERSGDEEVALPSEPFRPPVGLGPLPLGLADRARRLLQRQLELSTELTTAIQANRQHARLAARMRQAPTDPRPIFVDQAG